MADVNELASSLQSLKGLAAPSQAKLSNEERQQVLQKELAQVKAINSVVESVNDSILTAETNLAQVQVSAANANQLLDMWVRILSQTEHTQRLLSHPNWQGLTRDEELIAEHEAARARREEQLRLQRERERLAEIERKKALQEQADRRRARQDVMQRRVYGRNQPSAPKTPSSSRVASSRVPSSSASSRVPSRVVSTSSIPPATASTASSRRVLSDAAAGRISRPPQTSRDPSKDTSRIRAPTGIRTRPKP